MELWGGGTGGPNLSTTLLRPEPYIVNLPLAFRDCHSHIPHLLQKVTKTEILS
jgi:hypothetical protein